MDNKTRLQYRGDVKREVIKIPVSSGYVFGTVHFPKEYKSDGCARTDKPIVGFVFLNMGHAPRACHGNLIARIGDSLADMGYIALRFDLPGIGDSPGELPEREVPFWRFLLSGGFTELTETVIASFGERCQIDKFVLGGLCGGAIASVIVADAMCDRAAGTILLEPEFAMPALVRGRNPDNKELWSTYNLLQSQRIMRDRIVSLQSWYRVFIGKSAYRDHIRTLLTLLNNKINRLSGMKLPADTNHAAVNCWLRLIKASIPSLVVFSQDETDELVYKEIMSVCFKPNVLDRVVNRKSIPDTNHTFTTQGADSLVIQYIIEWVKTNFR